MRFLITVFILSVVCAGQTPAPAKPVSPVRKVAQVKKKLIATEAAHILLNEYRIDKLEEELKELKKGPQIMQAPAGYSELTESVMWTGGGAGGALALGGIVILLRRLFRRFLNGLIAEATRGPGGKDENRSA